MTRKVHRAAAAVVAALGLSGFAAAQSTSPHRVVFDMRVAETGAKEAVVTRPGDVLTLNLYVTVTGLDASLDNEEFRNYSGGFRSSAGGLLGNLVGLTPPYGTNSSVGQSGDVDDDGDLDIGRRDLTQISNGVNYSTISGGNPLRVFPVGGALVGQVRFTATALSPTPTTVNFFPSRFKEFAANHFHGANGVIDGVITSFSGADSRLHITPGIVIRAAQIIDPGPVQHLSGTIDTHLTVSANVEPAPGATLMLASGLDVTSTGTFSALGTGNSVIINDNVSGNAGGRLASSSVTVGAVASGSFDQSGGFTNIGQISLGAAPGMTGNLAISGGTFNAQSLAVAAGGNGLVTQSSGAANLGGLVMGDGPGAAEYRMQGGDLFVTAASTIGKSADATFHQTGGAAHFSTVAALGATGGGRGFLKVDGGTFSAQTLLVGGAGFYGQVDQTHGAVHVSRIEIGRATTPSPTCLGQYNLAGGNLHADVMLIGDNANGLMNQTGGNATVERLILKGTGSGAYELHNGALATGLAHIGWKNGPVDTDNPGLFKQNGGQHTVGDLAIGTLGVYQLNGGTLTITKSLRHKGTIDFGNSSATLIAAGGSLLDFTNGSLANVASGTVHGSANSLMSFASQAAVDAIGNFSSDGIVHIAGQPITIAPNQSIGGSGTIQGNVNNNGTLAPGNSPGAIEVQGNYAQDPAAQLLIELAGTSPEQFDTLSVTGAAALGGTLSVSLLDGFVPSPGHSFQIITASSLTGRFDHVSFTGGTFDVLYSPTGVSLSNFSAVPEPGAMLVLLAAAPLLAARTRTRARPRRRR